MTGNGNEREWYDNIILLFIASKGSPFGDARQWSENFGQLDQRQWL